MVKHMYYCRVKDAVFHRVLFELSGDDIQKLMLRVKEVLEAMEREIEIVKYVSTLMTVRWLGRAKYRYGRTEMEVWRDEKEILR